MKHTYLQRPVLCHEGTTVFLHVYFCECLWAFISWQKFMSGMLSQSLKMNLDDISSLNSSSFDLCKIILAFIKLERSIWIGFSSDFILKYCERWCNSSETIVAILSYLGTCLSSLFGQLVLIMHDDWRLFMEMEGKEELQKQQASWKRKKNSSYKVKWSNSYSEINPSKTLAIGETNFIRMGMFDSGVGDKFRSWDFGWCVV